MTFHIIFGNPFHLLGFQYYIQKICVINVILPLTPFGFVDFPFFRNVSSHSCCKDLSWDNTTFRFYMMPVLAFSMRWLVISRLLFRKTVSNKVPIMEMKMLRAQANRSVLYYANGHFGHKKEHEAGIGQYKYKRATILYTQYWNVDYTYTISICHNLIWVWFPCPFTLFSQLTLLCFIWSMS